MNQNIMNSLINNSALLLSLGIIYEISYYLPKKQLKIMPVINGYLIGIIGILLMLSSFVLRSGLIFDTRSILLGASALTFGAVPSVIAAVITAAFRIYQGGIGAVTGVSVIAASTAIGLLFRQYMQKRPIKNRWVRIYLMGLLIHFVMLLCMFFLPWPQPLETVKAIGLPVMIIYPIVTVLLSQLLLHQKEREETIRQLIESEARYKSLFDNNHAAMMLTNPETAA